LRLPSILLLGDSHLTDYSWVGAEQLGPRLRALGCAAASQAVGGLTSRDALTTYRHLVPNERWCIVSLGGNDAVPANRIDIDEFRENYEMLVDRLPDSRVLLLGPAQVDEAASDVRGRRNSHLANLSDVVGRLAAQRSFQFLPLFDLLEPSTHLVDDGLHLNGSAYDLLTVLIAKLLRYADG
jgi:lysophospholipase L1-like esterase